MFKTKLFHSKSGKFFNYNFPTAGSVVFFIVIALVVTYIINFVLNQIWDVRILPLGKPLRFLIIGLALISAFFIIGRKQGDLDRNAIFAMLLIAGAAAALVYFLHKLLPELFSSFPILNYAYTTPNSPI